MVSGPAVPRELLIDWRSGEATGSAHASPCMTYREAAQIHWPPPRTIPRDCVAEWKEPLDSLDHNGALDDPAQKMSVDPEAEKAAYSLQQHRPLQTRQQDLAQTQAVSAQTMVVSPMEEVAEEVVEE